MTNKFDPTKPVQTRDGRAARIICTDRSYRGFSGSIVALVTSEPEGVELPHIFQSNGEVWGCVPHDDLINVPEEHTVWLNVYLRDGSNVSHPTRHEADTRAVRNRIACIEVTYKEGEGLCSR